MFPLPVSIPIAAAQSQPASAKFRLFWEGGESEDAVFEDWPTQKNLYDCFQVPDNGKLSIKVNARKWISLVRDDNQYPRNSCAINEEDGAYHVQMTSVYAKTPNTTPNRPANGMYSLSAFFVIIVTHALWLQ